MFKVGIGSVWSRLLEDHEVAGVAAEDEVAQGRGVRRLLHSDSNLRAGGHRPTAPADCAGSLRQPGRLPCQPGAGAATVGISAPILGSAKGVVSKCGSSGSSCMHLVVSLYLKK